MATYSAMKSLVRSTTFWAMVFCLLAAVSPALPWRYHLEQVWIGPVHSASAYTDWHGAVISVTAGVGFLFLLATSPLVPVPWWHPANRNRRRYHECFRTQ